MSDRDRLAALLHQFATTPLPYCAHETCEAGRIADRLLAAGVTLAAPSVGRTEGLPEVSSPDLAALRGALAWLLDYFEAPRYEGRHRTEPRCAVFMPTDGNCSCDYAGSKAKIAEIHALLESAPPPAKPDAERHSPYECAVEHRAQSVAGSHLYDDNCRLCAPDAERLDVERLYKAIGAHRKAAAYMLVPHHCGPDCAADIAAEYPAPVAGAPRLGAER